MRIALARVPDETVDALDCTFKGEEERRVNYMVIYGDIYNNWGFIVHFNLIASNAL